MTFKLGDRVRIKPELADSFVSTLRKFSTNGRVGTIKAETGRGRFGVQFDQLRRGRENNFYFWLYAREIELIEK